MASPSEEPSSCEHVAIIGVQRLSLHVACREQPSVTQHDDLHCEQAGRVRRSLLGSQ